MFWFIAIVLLIVAALWLLLSLRKPAVTTAHQADQLNIAIYRERLDELKQDLQNGTIAEQEFAEAKEELAAALSQDIQAQHAALHATNKNSLYQVFAIVAVFVLIISAGLHMYLRSKLYFEQNAFGPGMDSAQAQFAWMQQQETLKNIMNNQADYKLWDELGKQSLQMLRPDVAAQAFARARSINGDSVQRLLGQAQSNLMMNRNSDETAELFQRALAIEPSNPEVLFWGGWLHAQRGEIPRAIDYWQRAVNNLPPEHEQRKSITGLINEAQQKLAGSSQNAPVATANPHTAPNPHTSPAAAPAGGAKLSVNVQLDKKIADKAKPDDTVFILARAVNGPRMPLAIIQKKVSDLPVTVSLDDSTSMGGQPLSTYEQVTIVVRVSKSGQAMPQSGDLFGEVTPVSTKSNKPVTVQINQLVP